MGLFLCFAFLAAQRLFDGTFAVLSSTDTTFGIRCLKRDLGGSTAMCFFLRFRLCFCVDYFDYQDFVVSCIHFLLYLCLLYLCMNVLYFY